MLRCHRQNFHHSKLPEPGALGTIRNLTSIDPDRQCIVSHYPLTDSPDYRYAYGIHTVSVRFLDTGEVRNVSGIFFQAAIT